ncbi:DNA polymerase III subunit delta' [Beijerinckiaceae bacterium]|nr:DNA polymerase III subunit delta' [Beijerinckiaceae bacterium]
MARVTAQKAIEASPETDRFEDTPHPRENYAFFGHDAFEQEVFQSYLSGHLPQALIIGGPVGIGKATAAWRLARFVLANPDPARLDTGQEPGLFVPGDHPVSRQIAALSHPDLIVLRREWNAETKKPFTQISVEDVRRAIHLFQQAAGRGGYRVCIIDCAEDLNLSSANALLKLIEEPPPRSLFLIVAHRPGRMLATLRSRCRRMSLKPLGGADVERVVAALGSPWAEAESARLQAAIARGHGSMHDVLRLLDERGLELDTNLRRMLADLPLIDWGGVHALADRISLRTNSKDYETMLSVIEDWLDTQVRGGAETIQVNPARRLAPYALVWEKLAETARETETFNLDRRPLVLSLFADLAAATRAFLS